MTHKRLVPYTDKGIKRIPCYRCGCPSEYQWQICADGNQYRGICLQCDIALNRLVLTFMGDKDIEAKMSAYEDSKKSFGKG